MGINIDGTGFVSRDAQHASHVTATQEVMNPPLGSAVEQTLQVPILPNPAVLSSLTPASISAGFPPAPIIVAGSGFTTDAAVWADEQEQSTAYVSATELHYFAEATQAGSQTITVRNLGGTSNAIELMVA